MTTLSPSTTVGELVRDQPGRSRVFEALQIDYCCGGKQPLEVACQKRGLNVQLVVAQLQEADAYASAASRSVAPDAMSLTELADHIEREHHDYLRSELPRLDAITEKVDRVHRESDPRLARVRSAFCALRDELTSHMMKEERILFPMIRALEQGDLAASRTVGTIANPIQQMEAEHDHAGSALSTMREATDAYTPPDWACNTYRAMLDGLAHLERDMHQHVHKENNILFPKTLQLESTLLKGGAV